ncbi:hypothetical protein [Lederbergia lenta]|uniref:hypothetical protein n=1 Tax=Lederbergia lenta TaxID=1467 RepID=UPI002041A968|nr:hypothetical protein [Lederbergia lenta]MCM3109938.1 hypothetical protein [Lederbergia lenta]
MNFTFEKNKLYAYLGKDLVNALKRHDAYIAGGTITSLLSNRDINDIDVYFRNEESAIGFIQEFWEDRIHVVSHTKKATHFVYPTGHDPINLQVIHFNYFNSPEDIFETFDFTVCMGCFDFRGEEFIIHNDFLKHNSQRILKFNSKTAFPIVSLLRVQKYEDKGYKISKPEFIRIILTCMDLKIESYEELKEQTGGMYGECYDKLFEDVDSEDFNLQVAIEKIANLALSEDYFNKPVSLKFEDVEDILDTISKKPVTYININDDHYKVGYDGLLKIIEDKPENYTQVDTNKFFSETKFYKFVDKRDGEYFSFYNNKFEYELCKEITASSEGRNNGTLYFNEKPDLHNSTYDSREGKAAIEVMINPKDFINAHDGVVEAKKCFVIREVPKEEYQQWNGIVNDQV